MVQGSNPIAATYSLPFTPLCQCLSEEALKAVGPFYLVAMSREVKYPTSLHWKCVTCGLPHPLLDTSSSSSWTTLKISLKTFVCYPVNMMCSKSNKKSTKLVLLTSCKVLVNHQGSILSKISGNPDGLPR